MQLTRRLFGQTALSGLASSTTLLAQKKIPIAVQLYSIRQIAQKDLAGVLAQVAKLGFKGVEFAGYYGHEAPAVRKMTSWSSDWRTRPRGARCSTSCAVPSTSSARRS